MSTLPPRNPKDPSPPKRPSSPVEVEQQNEVTHRDRAEALIMGAETPAANCGELASLATAHATLAIYYHHRVRKLTGR